MNVARNKGRTSHKISGNNITGFPSPCSHSLPYCKQQLRDKEGEELSLLLAVSLFKVLVKENEVPTKKNSSRASISATKASYISN